MWKSLGWVEGQLELCETVEVLLKLGETVEVLLKCNTSTKNSLWLEFNTTSTVSQNFNTKLLKSTLQHTSTRCWHAVVPDAEHSKMSDLLSLTRSVLSLDLLLLLLLLLLI